MNSVNVNSLKFIINSITQFFETLDDTKEYSCFVGPKPVSDQDYVILVAITAQSADEVHKSFKYKEMINSAIVRLSDGEAYGNSNDDAKFGSGEADGTSGNTDSKSDNQELITEGENQIQTEGIPFLVDSADRRTVT